MTAVLRTPGKANWSMAMAEKKARLAKKKAEDASAAEAIARKRLFDEMSTGVSPKVAAPIRTSTKAFAAKDPQHALAVLGCLDLKDMSKHEFPLIDMTAYKYLVRTLSEKLVVESLYKSTKCSAMMAAKSVRFVFDVACEIGDVESTGMLQWQSAQSMLKGRETRGAGIVARTPAAMKLLENACVVAKTRVQERVDASDKYRRAMETTVAVSQSEKLDTA